MDFEWSISVIALRGSAPMYSTVHIKRSMCMEDFALVGANE